MSPPTKMSTMRKIENNKCWQSIQQVELSLIANGNEIDTITSENCLAVSTYANLYAYSVTQQFLS